MQLVERKKASRLSRDPIPKDASENGVVTWKRLKETDLDIIDLAHSHYVDVLHLAAYTGRSVGWMQKRTKVLKREPNLYITLCHQQRSNPEKYLRNQRQLFRSAPAGAGALEKRGRIVPYQFPNSSSFEHDVMADEGILSYRIGLKHHPEVGGITPHDILNRESVSPVTRADKDWHYFPIDAPHTKKKTAHPDFFPLGLKRPFDAPNKHPFFVPEFETGANNIEPAELDSSAVKSKILSWLDVMYEDDTRQPTYWTHIGIPNLYVMFLHYTVGRAQATLQIIEKHVPPEYQPFFLVKVHEGDWTEQHLPTGWFLEDDFMRACNPPFNLLTSELD